MRAIYLEKNGDKVSAAIRDIDVADLPDADVRVEIDYSCLNWKDGGAITGTLPVVRSYPMVPGVDFAGVVAESADQRFQKGDKVILNGWGVGEGWWGGLAEQARVKGDWLIKAPEGIDSRRAMGVGTAGYTAMLAVQALEDHGLKQGDGPVLVLGAAGGVGSVAVSILAKLGYEVAAVTGRADQAEYLKGLGATTIVPRKEMAGDVRPLDKTRWAGGIDAVGGAPLTKALSQMKYGASVASIGLAAGPEFTSSVFPFILRGVNLLGIDSVMCPRERRERAWARIAHDLPMDKLDAMIREITLDEVIPLAPEYAAGKVKGRVVVKLRG